jgi:Uma2 family endonuclease
MCYVLVSMEKIMTQMPVLAPERISLDAFEQFIELPENRDRLFELIDGRIVEKMPTELHGAIVARLIAYLVMYAEQHNLGRVTTEARHRASQDAENDRLPDIAFTRWERALPLVEQGAVKHMPDLAIEIKSPSNGYEELRAKARYYLQHGAQLVWLIYPEKKLIEVYRAGADSDILTGEDTLTGGTVLPEFSLPVKTVFDVR